MASTRKLILVRVFAAGFILFLIAVAVIANRGEGDEWWPLIYQIPFGDKLSHLVLFGTLCLLCNLTFPKSHRSVIPILTTPTFVLLWVITLDEASQFFIPTRNFEILDWLANVLGLMLGQILAQRLLCRITSPDKF